MRAVVLCNAGLSVFASILEVEAVAENHFGNQMIGGMRDADAEAEIDFPLRREIEVDDRKELVLLLACGKKIGGRTNRPVVFESTGDFSRKVVAELEIRRECDSLIDTFTVEGPVKGGIEREIPAAGLLVDNGANFPGPGVGRKSAPLITNLVGEAEANGPLPFLGYVHARPNVVAHPIPALAVLRGSENVEPGLEPIIKAVRNLDSLMELVIGGEKAVFRGLRTLKREVAVELDHGMVRLHLIVAVDLNFVVVLRQNTTRQNRAQKRQENACDRNAQFQCPPFWAS